MQFFKKSIICILIVCEIILGTKHIAFAFGEKEHNEQLEYVLFGKKNYSKTQEESIQTYITAIEYAAYLCIDQFNYNNHPVSDDAKLTFLRDLKVDDLPRDIENAVNYTAFGEQHRSYTHRGWNRIYSKSELDKSHWEIRRKLLISTIKRVFESSEPGLTTKVMSFVNDKNAKSKISSFEKKCEAMAEFIYYIHILGDYMYDLEEFEKSGESDATSFTIKGLIINIGGRNDDETIIHDLKDCLSILLSNSKGSHTIDILNTRLDEIDDELKKLNPTGNGLSTVGGYKKYASYASEIIELLHDFVPGLLRNEDYFVKVFP